MTNSIDPVVDGAFHRVADRRADGAGDGRSGSAAASGGEQSADKLDLTGRAQALRALEKELSKTPEFDASRVQEMKDALAGGRFEVNAERIAEKLLAMESQLP